MKKNLPSLPPGSIDMQLPPRQRLLAAARLLFMQYGIRAVGVDSIAEAAGSNKMTLYRHFESKDCLVAEYLRGMAPEEAAFWEQLAAAHAGDPRGQLEAWLGLIVQGLEGARGCPLSNAAVEIPEKDHPARAVIEEQKMAGRNRILELCRALGARSPELLADELFLLIEGARVSAQSVGPQGPGAQVKRMADALIQAHTVSG